MLALAQMSAGFQAFFFIVAIVLCVLGAFRITTKLVDLFPLGVALFILVFAYNAVAATGKG